MEKPVFTVGERVEKLCITCNEVRGHVVVSVTKRGQISRVSCPKCEVRLRVEPEPTRAQRSRPRKRERRTTELVHTELARQ